MKLAIVKPNSDAEKTTRTVVDTIEVTPELVNSWKAPPFQRPVRENNKVLALAEDLKRNDGVWPGVVTLGVLGKDVYLLDGQHRRASFLISGCKVGYTDVRTHYVSSMAEMGEEFVRLNSSLSQLRPDDILRGLEASLQPLQDLRKRCPFVGYDMVRRGNTSAPMVSMSVVLRCWSGSSHQVPSANASAQICAQSLDAESSSHLADFLQLAYQAFGRDPEYYKLWSSLNLTICMWLYRNMVLTTYSARVPKLSKDLFRKCLMGVSTNSMYIEWLVGRNLGDRDRSPAYSRLRASFADRLTLELGNRPAMPSPPWHTNSGSREYREQRATGGQG